MISGTLVGSTVANSIRAATVAPERGTAGTERGRSRELVFEPAESAAAGRGARLAWHACSPSGRVIWVCPAPRRSGLIGDQEDSPRDPSTRGDVLEVGHSTAASQIFLSLTRLVDLGDAVHIGSVHQLIATVGLEVAMAMVGEILGWCATEEIGFVVSCDPEAMTDPEIRSVIREFETFVDR